jgi:hypothetical protein
VPFILQGSYFGRRRFEARDERNGLQMHFAGWSLSLEDYASALEEARLAIVSLREPTPAPVGEYAHLKRWARIPLFLWLKARPLPGKPGAP